MKAISNLYYSTKDLLVTRNNEVTKTEAELKYREFGEYLDRLESENEELKTENLYLKNYNGLLENANLNLKFTKDILESKLEEFTDREEIKEILDTDKPLDKTNLLIDKIEKLEDNNETYKEVIKTMCDKFDIPTESVINIIDHIQADKGQQIERV